MFGRGETKHQADLEVFTIFDSKTQSYWSPTYAVNRHDFTREMINMLRDPRQAENKLVQNPEDFSVFCIGSFDRKTGKMLVQNLEHIANVHDLMAVAKNQMGSVPT